MKEIHTRRQKSRLSRYLIESRTQVEVLQVASREDTDTKSRRINEVGITN